MDRFATRQGEFEGVDRKLLVVGPCDGSSFDYTLAGHLKRLGLLKGRWKSGEHTPGSVFYWFRHVAALQFVPDSLELVDSWHCGVCFKHPIKLKFTMKNMAFNKPLNITEHADILLPKYIVTGSECIHLSDDMRNLVRYMREHGIMPEGGIRFVMGRFDAMDIVRNYAAWEFDTVALPVRWFYFKPEFRHVLYYYRWSRGYGLHVVMPPEGRGPGDLMHRASRFCRSSHARDLFWGMDEYDRPATMDTPNQCADKYGYVVLERGMMKTLMCDILTEEKRRRDERR